VFGSEMFYGPPDEMLDAIEDCQREDGSIDASKFGSAAMKNIMPLWMLKYLPNMPACHVGIAVNSHGPNNTLVLGDVSGPAAVVEAASCISRGTVPLMISGATGTRINTTRLNYHGCLPIGNIHEPLEHSSRPHDPTAQGVIGGEAAAAFILESANRAAARNAKPLAELVSYATCFAPSAGMNNGSLGTGRGSSDAIRAAINIAIKDAGIEPSEIGVVVSHACGDPEIDAAERAALSDTLPEQPVVAPIASLGHTGAASGSIEMATAVLALVHQTVPPTICVESTSEQIRFLDQPQPLQGDYALSLTYTSEGNATALLLRRC
jgi:3-oxoacyl-[acyl-carrier-protein] synthase II